MNESVIQWLTEPSNPAVAYRTRTELLGETADKRQAVDWVNGFLPADWQDVKGLWARYHLAAIAECGLTHWDIEIDDNKALSGCLEGRFEDGCADFMYLRALVMLGYGEHAAVRGVLHDLPAQVLPDGGFLCLRKRMKRGDVPKSCAKAVYYALMLCAECRKRGFLLDIEAPVLRYLRAHNVLYKTSDLATLMLDGREGWRVADAFYPFEPMRIGLMNLAEALAALGQAGESWTADVFERLAGLQDAKGRVTLGGTLTKSYLPKERVGKPSKWATFYALLAEKEAGNCEYL